MKRDFTLHKISQDTSVPSRSRLANSTWASAPYTASRVRVDSTLTRDTRFHTETSCRSTRTLCSCYLKYGSSRAQSGSAQPHADLLHGTFTLPTRSFTEARSPASTRFRKSSPKDRNPGNSHEGQRDSQKATAPPVIGAVDETSALQRARETDGHERELEAFGSTTKGSRLTLGGSCTNSRMQIGRRAHKKWE